MSAYAISIDFRTERLKEEFGETNYTKAYSDVARILEKYKFYKKFGDVYVCAETLFNPIVNVLDAVNALKECPWFKHSVGSIYVFKIDEISNVTPFVLE